MSKLDVFRAEFSQTVEEAYTAAMLHFAHSHKERPQSDWHRLDQHLHSTAERAERFAAPFAKEWGRLAGLWHDAGKYQKAFQDYLAATGDHTGPKVDHSSVGALIAWEKRAAPLAFVVAGHHGGLSNKQDLVARMKAKRDLLDAAREFGLPPSLENLTKPGDPSGLSETARALWIRFLFSALVDADYLDTESFFQDCERDTPSTDLGALAIRLDAYLDERVRRVTPRRSTFSGAMFWKTAGQLLCCPEVSFL
jgi:CRISPR-associated endonuclease/helicase Cas3